jgi:hypothetical protein
MLKIIEKLTIVWVIYSDLYSINLKIIPIKYEKLYVASLIINYITRGQKSSGTYF